MTVITGLSPVLIRVNVLTMKLSRAFIKHAFKGYSGRTWMVHLGLFALTFVSTTWIGSHYAFAVSAIEALIEGLYYSIPLMIILTAHEMGHYLQARAYGVSVTMPYFIPLPIPYGFGTMGAFIRMKSPAPARHALFDIAYWGPAMSFFLSVPVTAAGLALSKTVPVTHLKGLSLVYGEPLLFQMLIPVMLDVPAGHEVIIHPMAFAGWVGLFVTAINLLPVGQLDGGHLAYTVFGKRQKDIARVIMGFMIIMTFLFQGWFIWVLLLLVMGMYHPDVSDYFLVNYPLDKKRKRQAVYALVFFVLSFVPVPVAVNDSTQKQPPLQQQDDGYRAEHENLSAENFATQRIDERKKIAYNN